MNDTLYERREVLQELGFKIGYKEYTHRGMYISLSNEDIEKRTDNEWQSRLTIIKEAMEKRGCVAGKVPFYFLRTVDGRRQSGSDYDGISWSRDFDWQYGSKDIKGLESDMERCGEECIEIVTVYI